MSDLLTMSAHVTLLCLVSPDGSEDARAGILEAVRTTESVVGTYEGESYAFYEPEAIEMEMRLQAASSPSHAFYLVDDPENDRTIVMTHSPEGIACLFGFIDSAGSVTLTTGNAF